MKDFSEFLNSNVSDELLAAYIDGNTTAEETLLIENSIKEDSIISEANEIVGDSTSFGSGFDWELHKGDFGFWELELPPAVSQKDFEQPIEFSVQGVGENNITLQHEDFNNCIIPSTDTNINDDTASNYFNSNNDY